LLICDQVQLAENINQDYEERNSKLINIQYGVISKPKLITKLTSRHFNLVPQPL